eukprot:5597748-Lingulodinium_polyedra.AAC.1
MGQPLKKFDPHWLQSKRSRAMAGWLPPCWLAISSLRTRPDVSIVRHYSAIAVPMSLHPKASSRGSG